MINTSNLSTALPWFLKDNNTFNKLQNDFPEILADLVTFKSNPNCSCKGRVLKFFTEKMQQDPALLNKYIYNETELNIELNKAELLRQQNNYSGKIMIIPKNNESWSNFAKEINNGKFFRSFSIVERENEIAVYFL